MPDAGTAQAEWLAALEKRHLAHLTRQEFTRAVRALSARYVERRGQLPDRSPLDSAGKRAAFGLFYGPIHFLTAALALARTGVRADLTSLVDLGCGTGVCSAAWALMHDTVPAITGVDANAWAIDEARRNWRTLRLRGHAVRGDLVTTARGLLRQSNATLATTGIIAGWAVNELAKTDRDQLLDVLDQLLERGATFVMLEPLARGVAPWWDAWVARLAPRGIQAGDVKADVDLPEPLASFSDSAGFRKKELGARVMSRGTEVPARRT
ncbi:MAG: methyltransferase [Vicinamibacterales bacterium]